MRMLSVITTLTVIPFCWSRGRFVPARRLSLCRKLTFEEPYQAIKFATKEDVHKYLETKYQDYTGEGLALSLPLSWIMKKWAETK